MKVSYIFILLSFVLIQCAGETRDDSKKDKSVDKGAVDEVKQKEKKVVPHRFVSTEMGVREYMSMRQNKAGEKEWFYSTEKNPKDIKLGVTTANGLHAVYFLNKPEELYVLDLENCGFMLTDGEDNAQWYRQIEPECGM